MASSQPSLWHHFPGFPWKHFVVCLLFSTFHSFHSTSLLCTHQGQLCIWVSCCDGSPGIQIDYLLSAAPTHLVTPALSLALLKSLQARPFRCFMLHCYSSLSCYSLCPMWQFEWEVFFTGSCIWTLDPWLVVLTGQVMGPLGGRTLLDWALRVDSLPHLLFPLCFKCMEEQVNSWLPVPAAAIPSPLVSMSSLP